MCTAPDGIPIPDEPEEKKPDTLPKPPEDPAEAEAEAAHLRAMRMYWILDDEGKPKPVDDVMIWARWFEKGNRILKRTQVGTGFISTVFLGIDHAWGGGPPVLWETMIFDVPGVDQYQHRYRSKEDALKDHSEIVIAAVAAWERAHGKTPKVITYGLIHLPKKGKK